MIAFILLVSAQLAAATPVRPVRPVLQFPEPGLDDSAAYAGYVTRFYRDVHRNTLQVYLDRREGRVVHLFANGENESIGFSARAADGTSAPLTFESAPARVSRRGRSATFVHSLASSAARIDVGRFVLASMRVERDVQYFKEHRKPFGDPPYALDEFTRLADRLESLPATLQRLALRELHAPNVAALRARLRPAVTAMGATAALVQQPSLDALDTLTLRFDGLEGTTLTIDPATTGGQRITLRAASNRPLRVQLTVTTTGRALAPLSRDEIFTADFLAWARSLPRTDERARWVERQITGVELLSSRDKLMAGLPTYATYFGRDMMLSALMMQPVWRAEMNEFVISAALRKLAPNGEVSHEEALGGQALREAAAEATALLARADSTNARATADSLRRRALRVLAERRTTRENYHMVDDEYQLPLIVARYLDDARLTDAHKRAWLLARDGGSRRVDRMLQELAVVAAKTAPYAASPVFSNLVSFASREPSRETFPGEERWFAQSWRDSGAGYGNGRYAMDINTIYVPQALRATSRILAALRRLGLGDALASLGAAPSAPTRALARYVTDPRALARAIETWDGAGRLFTVRLTADEVSRAVNARLGAMPAAEAAFWRESARGAAVPELGALEFDAVALDAAGQPVRVANSDLATRLFLDGLMGGARGPTTDRSTMLRDVALMRRPYPSGLLVPGVGPVVANDAYARPAVWQAFDADPYHGPRVVWGREVNLFLLGVASQLAPYAADTAATRALTESAQAIRRAVDASGFHSELWSYGVRDGRVRPERYGSGADIQLWSTTDLAVQYVWDRRGR